MTARTPVWVGTMLLALAGAAHAAVTISTDKTKKMHCVGGVCTPTAGNANLNAKYLLALLGASDVTVKSGADATSIGVLSQLAWGSSHRLTLDAAQSVHIRAPVIVQGLGGVTLTTNDGGTGGDYTFNLATSGSIKFLDTESSLIINGQSFTLVTDLKTLASDITANPSGHFALAGSYDASDDGVYNSPPVMTSFSGAFEGLGNSLSNLAVTTNGNAGAGLFYNNYGLIRDIAFVNASIHNNFGDEAGAVAAVNEGTIAYASSHQGMVTATKGPAGSLVGSNSGTIGSSWSDGEVEVDGGYAGGLVGVNTGTISLSNSAATAGAQARMASWVGGIAGENGGTIEFAAATGNVVGAVAGGIAGSNVGAGIISHCRSSGNVTAKVPGPRAAFVVGGLAGWNDAGITQSFATGQVLGPAKGRHGPIMGGLVGATGGGTISYSYATGSVSSRRGDAGGLIGISGNGSIIVQAYASGEIKVTYVGWLGGLIGFDYQQQGDRNSLDYWDLDTTGISNPHQGAGNIADDPGITGLTDAQLKSGLPAGFDPTVWGQNAAINNGYPYLLANPPQ
jgi:hypothetical protein